MSLTLEEANRIVDVAIAKAKELNLGMAVAVCDAQGRLVAFNRIEWTPWITAYGSEGKAIAATAFGRPSVDLEEVGAFPAYPALAVREGGHMAAVQGALPIYRDGKIIGAVGASGGTGQEDEDCARAGIEALTG